MLAKEYITGWRRFFFGTVLILIDIILRNYVVLVVLRPESLPRTIIGSFLDAPLGWIAALFGAGLIAGEARTGTIAFLLSRPLSRERALLSKYGVSAGFLLVFAVFGVVFGTLPLSILIDLKGPVWPVMLTSLFYDWLGALVFLGIGLVLSILCRSSLIAFAMTQPLFYGIWLIKMGGVYVPVGGGFLMLRTPLRELLPSIGASFTKYWFFSGSDYELLGYLPAIQILLTRLVVAAIMLGLALFLFRRKAY